MPGLASIHLGATCALAGLIWTVQLALYPLFARVPADAFPAYHAAHTNRIGFVVGLLMLTELLTAALLLLHGARQPLFLASLVPLALAWIITALVFVPLHQRLARAFDPTAHRALVRANWLRTAAWTLRAALLLAAASDLP